MPKKVTSNAAVLRTQIFNMKRRAADMPPGPTRDKLETEIAKKEEALQTAGATVQKK